MPGTGIERKVLDAAGTAGAGFEAGGSASGLELLGCRRL